ncbi:uncharacterized protein O3Q21_005782 [Podargus strigoides]
MRRGVFCRGRCTGAATFPDLRGRPPVIALGSRGACSLVPLRPLLTAEAALRTRLSAPAPGMPLSAPASGSRGLCLPGLALLAARGRKGRGGAVPGCGRELPWLQLERPEKGKEEETEGYPTGSCLSTWRTAERQELQKRKEGPKEKEASYLANAPSSATSESCVQLGRLLQGGGLCLHRLRPRVRVWPLHLVLHRASWEGVSSISVCVCLSVLWPWSQQCPPEPHQQSDVT